MKQSTIKNPPIASRSTATDAYTHSGKALCDQCGTPFHKTRRWHRFCQAACRKSWHAEIMDLATKMKEAKLNKGEV